MCFAHLASIFHGKVTDLPVGRAPILSPENQVPELPVVFGLAAPCILAIGPVPAGLQLLTPDEVGFRDLWKILSAHSRCSVVSSPFLFPSSSGLT